MNVLAYRVYATMFFYIAKLYWGLLGPNVEVKVRGRSTCFLFSWTAKQLQWHTRSTSYITPPLASLWLEFSCLTIEYTGTFMTVHSFLFSIRTKPRNVVLVTCTKIWKNELVRLYLPSFKLFPHRKQELCRRINVMRICFHVLVTVSYICILRLCFCPRHLDCVVTRCASVREFICYMCVMTYLCTIIHVVDSILYGHSFHDQKKNSSAYLPFCDHFVF